MEHVWKVNTQHKSYIPYLQLRRTVLKIKTVKRIRARSRNHRTTRKRWLAQRRSQALNQISPSNVQTTKVYCGCSRAIGIFRLYSWRYSTRLSERNTLSPVLCVQRFLTRPGTFSCWNLRLANSSFDKPIPPLFTPKTLSVGLPHPMSMLILQILLWFFANLQTSLTGGRTFAWTFLLYRFFFKLLLCIDNDLLVSEMK